MEVVHSKLRASQAALGDTINTKMDDSVLLVSVSLLCHHGEEKQNELNLLIDPTVMPTLDNSR